jgi:predicted Holliday junction resolvase-like endonuclease/predicted RNA-binding Zn-ribbon protein involved in translation (DUF1610 family)
MALELELLVAGILVGTVLGILIVYAVLARRVEERAEGIAHGRADRMFEQQRASLEIRFREVYDARFQEWKATELTETVGRARQDTADKQRYIVKGKVGEQMAPLFPEFAQRYAPADARFIGSPVDYIIFDNLSQVAEGSEIPLEIVFLDIKTGEKATLSTVQRRIRDAVEARRVRWETMKLSIAPETEGAPAEPAKPGHIEFTIVSDHGRVTYLCPNCGGSIPSSDARITSGQLLCPRCGKPLTKGR